MPSRASRSYRTQRTGGTPKLNQKSKRRGPGSARASGRTPSTSKAQRQRQRNWKGKPAGEAIPRLSQFFQTTDGSQSSTAVREKSVLTVAASSSSALSIIHSKRPWIVGSCVLHPLEREQFWEKYFGRQALVLKRGPYHPKLLSPATAAGLLQNLRIWDSFELEWSHPVNPSPPLPNSDVNMYAQSAMEQGWLVHTTRLKGRIVSKLSRDPLLSDIRRYQLNQRTKMTLTWASHGVHASPIRQLPIHQVVQQVTGARQWTVCTPSAPEPEFRASPLNSDSAWAFGGKCRSVVLRSGDVLYIQPYSRHWASGGPIAAAHFTLSIRSLVAADLAGTAGALKHLVTMGVHPALGAPLPVWRCSGMDACQSYVSSVCRHLPWEKTGRTPDMMCTAQLMKIALERLARSANRAISWQTEAIGRGTVNVNYEQSVFDHRVAPGFVAQSRNANYKQSWFNHSGAPWFMIGFMLTVFLLSFALVICIVLFPEEGPPARKPGIQSARAKRKMNRQSCHLKKLV